jgi:hypothetical protein
LIRANQGNPGISSVPVKHHVISPNLGYTEGAGFVVAAQVGPAIVAA